MDKLWKTSVDQDQVYEIKFQGKPLNTFPLTNSKKEKIVEKNKINEMFLSTKKLVTKIARPKNKDKNKGTSIRAKGIKPLKVASWVKEIEIQ